MIPEKFFVKILLIIGVVGGSILLAIIGVLKIVILTANPANVLLCVVTVLIIAIAIFSSPVIANYIAASVRKNIKSTTKHETTGL